MRACHLSVAAMCTVSRGETCARSDLRHREPDTNGVPRVQEVVIGSQTAGEMQKCVMPGPADGEPSAFRTDSTRREGINWPRGWGGGCFFWRVFWCGVPCLSCLGVRFLFGRPGITMNHPSIELASGDRCVWRPSIGSTTRRTL